MIPATPTGGTPAVIMFGALDTDARDLHVSANHVHDCSH